MLRRSSKQMIIEMSFELKVKYFYNTRISHRTESKSLVSNSFIDKNLFLQGNIGNIQIILEITKIFSAGIYFIQISPLPLEEGIVVHIRRQDAFDTAFIEKAMQTPYRCIYHTFAYIQDKLEHVLKRMQSPEV